MCLSRIDAKMKVKDPKAEVKAFGVFYRSGDSNYPCWDGPIYDKKGIMVETSSAFSLSGACPRREYSIGPWYSAKGRKIYCPESGAYYRAGFHKFATKRAARIYAKRVLRDNSTVVLELRLKDIVVTGKQVLLRNAFFGRSVLKTYVAKKMRVIREIKTK